MGEYMGFEEMLDKMKTEAPSGLIDLSNYVSTLRRVVLSLKHLAENNPSFFMVDLLMTITNDMSDPDSEIDVEKFFEVITSMAFVITYMSKTFDSDNLFNFVRFLEQEVIPSMENDATAMPYWEP